MTDRSSERRHQRRRETTRLHVVCFWIAFVTSGVVGIKLVDRAVGLSTDFIDGAIASPHGR